MMRRFFVVASLIFIPLFAVPSFSQIQQIKDAEIDDLAPKEKIRDFEHVLVLGINQPFSKGYDKYSPLFFYAWFGEKFKNKDLYMQFTMSTTRIFYIAAFKNDRIYAGVKPLLEHSTYSAWRSYNRGTNDTPRQFGGNNIGVGVFFQYSFFRILSAKISYHTSYHFYRMFLLAENDNKYPNMPHRHWQVKPGVELILSDVKETGLGRIKHGYMLKGEYYYARRIGYGTWYDYDRLWFHEKLNGQWAPPTGMTEGVWYKSKVNSTHRLYFSFGGYYNFKHDVNLLFDYYGGYFKGVDRNNAEQIGYMQADYGIMPGYASTEFFHNFYMIARLQLGIPLKFWDARIQPGYNVLYMPKTNEVVGVGKGFYAAGRGALLSYHHLALHGYPRRFYSSVSCSFSLRLGNLLPVFIDYAYGFDAVRSRSSVKMYMNKLERGCHEVQVLFVMAFGSNVEKKDNDKEEGKKGKG